MGIAPMNDPELVCYIALNNPVSYIQYGGTVVAPIVREVLIECLNILDVPKQEGGHKLITRLYIDKNRYIVDNYVGKLRSQIRLSPYYKIEIIGDGDKVITQMPNPNEIIEEGNTIYLYTN
jgi:stage V sporulation protein D (sporulation-specific penicillin-binding protein)